MRSLVSTLKPGVDPAECEQRVRKCGYALGRTKPNYVSHTLHLIRGPIAGAEAAGWQYIERIEVRSLEQHDRDLDSPEGVPLREGLYVRFLDRSRGIYFAADSIE